ncbi:MAG TPA: hypothetical protein VNK24_10900 [Elusimicrobiota bacterium]|nr:hypothetical protein [Elusimicrobiota bacterium]
MTGRNGMNGAGSIRSFRFAAALLAAALAAPAAAAVAPRGVVLEPAGWFAIRPRRGLKTLDIRHAQFVPIKAVSGASPRAAERIRPRIKAVNRGDAPAEGILIRYDFALEVAPKSDAKKAAWAVPFMMDEWRIPRLLPGESKGVALDPEILRQTLARLDAAGFTAVRLRFEAMLEPRSGDPRPLQTVGGGIAFAP